MTANWENFEWACTEYLNIRFGYYAEFIHQGGSDSTVPDILAISKNGTEFYLEAKLSPAQCGQFVLLPETTTKTFKYSNRNKSNINKYSAAIIEHMNKHFEKYKEAGTKGENINMINETEIFAGWVMQTYRDKGVKFIITNDYTIFPLENFRNYFNVTATYRIKRSGSRDVGKKLMKNVASFIKTCDYGITSCQMDDNKLFIHSNAELDNQRFVLGEYEYMFAKRNKLYEVRKLSNTYNANVIFSIELKPNAVGITDEEFIAHLA